jgi:hypothetical protein
MPSWVRYLAPVVVVLAAIAAGMAVAAARVPAQSDVGIYAAPADTCQGMHHCGPSSGVNCEGGTACPAGHAAAKASPQQWQVSGRGTPLPEAAAESPSDPYLRDPERPPRA